MLGNIFISLQAHQKNNKPSVLDILNFIFILITNIGLYYLKFLTVKNVNTINYEPTPDGYIHLLDDYIMQTNSKLPSKFSDYNLRQFYI